MRKALRLGAAALVAAGMVPLLPSPAGALVPDKVGWWNKAKPVSLPEAGVPSTVASDELPVANDGSPACETERAPADPCGGAIIAALRYTVPPGADTRLSLRSSGGNRFAIPAGVTIAACLATSVWDGVANGAWADRPTYDCTQLSAGGSVTLDGEKVLPPDAASAAQEGDGMVWELPALFQVSPGAIDIVLVPAGNPVPFQITFAAPDDAALAVTSEPTADPTASEPAPEPVFDPTAGFATLPDTVAPDLGLGAAGPSAAAGAAPAAEGPATASRDGGVPFRQVGRPLPPADTTLERLLAVAVLLAFVAAWWWIGGQSTARPRLLGALAARRSGAAVANDPPAPALGGVGRFARPRSHAPRRL